MCAIKILKRKTCECFAIVHQDQTCGVVGRTIFSNLSLLHDVLDMIDKTNESGILVSLDQEKTFDRVDHDFMMRVLRKFGFGPSFCNWVELFYAKTFSRILVNGSLSPLFFFRGVLDRAARFRLYFMFWSRKSYPQRYVDVRILKASCSLEPGAFNIKSHSMPMMPLVF